MRSLMVELHEHEGRPVEEIESAAPDLVKLAAAQGLIDATEITTAAGKRATFHFTPRFRGFGVSRDDVPDVLDQVKLVGKRNPQEGSPTSTGSCLKLSTTEISRPCILRRLSPSIGSMFAASALTQPIIA